MHIERHGESDEREPNPVKEAFALLGTPVPENMTFQKMAELYLEGIDGDPLIPRPLRMRCLSAIRSARFGEVSVDTRMWAEDMYGILVEQERGGDSQEKPPERP